MTKNELISIIIVNWNGYSNLRECLNSLFKAKSKFQVEIIIVDNGSQDKSIQYIQNLQKKHKKLVLLKNKKNLGYAEGNNIGFKRAKGKFVLFLNNDTLVTANFFDPLVHILENDTSVAAVQPKILNYPKKQYIDSVGSYLLSTGFLYHKGHNKRDKKRYNTKSEIFTMKGACMLFRKSVLDRIQVFDKNYFAYFEETDLCQRVWLSGNKVCFIPDSVIYHKGGETSKHLANSFVQYHSYKNRIYTYLKNFQIGTLLKILPLHLLLCEIASVVYLITAQFPLFFAIQKALFWNVAHIAQIRKDRKRIHKIRKVKDKEYLHMISSRVKLTYYYHLFVTALAGYED